MKVLVVAIDALDPRLVFKYIDELPHLKKLIEAGVGGAYGGYANGYGSSENWVTLYTGLEPKVHGIKQVKVAAKEQCVHDYTHQQPYWEVMGEEKNLKIGIIDAYVTLPGIKINGYMAISDRGENFKEDVPEGTYLTPIFDDYAIQKQLIGNIDYPKRPRDLEEIGGVRDDIKQSEDVLREVFARDDYFEEGLECIDSTMTFWENNIGNIQQNFPVDVMWVYTAMLDLVQHFQIYDAESRVIVEAMKRIDQAIGKILEDVKPENVIVLSDHGMSSFAEVLNHSDIEVQKEAFGWRDKACWVNAKKVFVGARNGGILSGLHEYEGMFIASGKKIKQGPMPQMRSVDFYPTLLELCGVKIPEGRSGMVLDIFEGELLNTPYAYKLKEKKEILIIQNIDLNFMNTVINETYLENRFATITVMCPERYQSIFEKNHRIDKIIPVPDIHCPTYDQVDYDSIFVGTYSVYENKVGILKIK